MRTSPNTRVHSPADLAQLIAPRFRGARRETVIVVAFGAGLRPIHSETVSLGTAEFALLPVREVLVAVLRADGVAFALAHNHPSGDVTPSPEDVDATRRMAEASGIVGLRFLDHLIFADGRWLSLRESGFLA